jgi:hypothetical protein
MPPMEHSPLHALLEVQFAVTAMLSLVAILTPPSWELADELRSNDIEERLDEENIRMPAACGRAKAALHWTTQEP